MMRLLRISMLALVVVAGCSKPLELPDTKPDTSILVLEGDIVTGTDMENTVLLSRVRSLQDTTPSPESNARVEIVSKTGGNWPLTMTDAGKYTATATIPADNELSLHVQTADGSQYETPFQASKPSPPIDSVTFRQEKPDEVTIYVHSHDPSNNTRYYRWSAEETWERTSSFQSLYNFDGASIVPKAVGEQNYTCWRTQPTNTIVIANTLNLAQDVISYQPVTTIQSSTEKIYVRYSILVKQIALSRESYDFWNTLRKNTELTGSLFDPQPSQYQTNITCTNNAGKRAIGFVSVSGTSEKRLFIRNSEVNSWPTFDPAVSCSAIELSRSGAEDFLKSNPNFLVAYFITAGGGFAVAPQACVDCRLTGGDVIKPSFW